MEKKIKKTLYSSFNIARIIFAVILLFVFFSDIQGISIDPDTYEKVYTGEFLGEYRFESLFQLKLSLWIGNILLTIYLLFVILRLTKFKDYKAISLFLRIVDVFMAYSIGYLLYKIIYLSN